MLYLRQCSFQPQHCYRMKIQLFHNSWNIIAHAWDQVTIGLLNSPTQFFVFQLDRSNYSSYFQAFQDLRIFIFTLDIRSLLGSNDSKSPWITSIFLGTHVTAIFWTVSILPRFILLLAVFFAIKIQVIN